MKSLVWLLKPVGKTFRKGGLVTIERALCLSDFCFLFRIQLSFSFSNTLLVAVQVGFGWPFHAPPFRLPDVFELGRRKLHMSLVDLPLRCDSY